MKQEIKDYNPSLVMDYVRKNYETDNLVRYIGKMYVENDRMYIEVQEQDKDKLLLDWKEISFELEDPKLEYMVYGKDYIINKVELLEAKLRDAVDYLKNADYSRNEAMEMDKEDFVSWCTMWENINSNGVVVITQEMISEWEQEWEEGH